MGNMLGLLPLYAVIAVLGVLVIAVVILVQAVVRISHALMAQANSIEKISATMKLKSNTERG